MRGRIPAGALLILLVLGAASPGRAAPAKSPRSRALPPAVAAIEPADGSAGIAEDQAFVLALDAKVSEKSAAGKAFFTIEETGEVGAIRIVKGAFRRAVIAAAGMREADAPLLVVRSLRRFPSDARVTLTWGRGIAGTAGPPTVRSQLFRFRTRRPLEASFACTEEKEGAGCAPHRPIRLLFNAPVPREKAERIALVGSGGKTHAPEIRGGGNGGPASSIVFHSPFPERSSLVLAVPADLRDLSGRPLSNRNELPRTVRIGPLPRFARLSRQYMTVPLRATATIPVPGGLPEGTGLRLLRVTDEEAALGWLVRLADGDARRSALEGVSGITDLPGTANGPGPPDAVSVAEPGLYIVEARGGAGPAARAGHSGAPVRAAALATTLAIDFRQGRESSMVWVTRADTGLPVRDAGVVVRDCARKTLWHGTTDGRGLARIRGALSTGRHGKSCSPCEGFFVSARTPDGDLAFIFSNWNEGDGRERPARKEPAPAPYIAHTLFDRDAARTGEVVRMKHVVRRHSMSGLHLLKDEERPEAVRMRNRETGRLFDLPLDWSEPGAAESAFLIPDDADPGLYEAVLLRRPRPDSGPGAANGNGASAGAERNRPTPLGSPSGSLRVEKPAPPPGPGDASIAPPAGPLVRPRSVTLDIRLPPRSGSAGTIPALLRSRMIPRRIDVEGYDGVTFANGRLEPGVRRLASPGIASGGAAGENGRRGATRVFRTKALRAGGSGKARAVLADLPEVSSPHEIAAELEYGRRGETPRKAVARVPLWPSRLLVGIEALPPASPGQGDRFRVVTADLAGRPAPAVPVTVEIFRRTTRSRIRRLAGGLKVAERTERVRKIGRVCTGNTDAAGSLVCRAAPGTESEGMYVQARAEDAAGRPATAWIPWRRPERSKRADGAPGGGGVVLVPEGDLYRPGDVARLAVRTPFDEAFALVTVEREGVLDAQVVRLFGKRSVVDVPVKGEYAPNVFVSVACPGGTRGGAGPEEISAGSGRLEGTVGLAVDRTAHELVVKVLAKTVPGDPGTARIRIAVTRRDGLPLPRDGEVSVAVVGEGESGAAPNRSLDILAAMMAPRDREVAPCAPEGIRPRDVASRNGPAPRGARETLGRRNPALPLAWRARVPLDEKGEALLEVPLESRAALVRVSAVALAGPGLFGTGQAVLDGAAGAPSGSPGARHGAQEGSSGRQTVPREPFQ